MHLKDVSVHTSSVAGFAVLPKEALVQIVLQGSAVTTHGDFVLSIEGELYADPIIILHSSQIAAIPWYYGVFNGKCYHGKSVFDVWKAAGISWEWDHVALYAINNLEHCIDDLTIHSSIKRLPSHCTLIFFKGNLEILMHPDKLMPSNYEITLDEAVHQYQHLVKNYLANSTINYFVSLSAGLDSRLLLASLLHHGVTPITATMGSADCTDVRIAKNIAADFALEHQQISLQESDYHNENKIYQILHLTSGTKSLRHWHTYFFIEKFRHLQNTIHFAGTNGELVRAYFFDKGRVSSLLQNSGNFIFQTFIKAKLSRGDQFVIPSLQIKNLQQDIFNRLSDDASSLGFMQRLSHLYSNQRVRHFTGKGMALYQDILTTVSPFLDDKFIEIASALPLKYTLNSIFHKACIKALCPQLLNYPNSDNSIDIRGTNQSTYFLKKMRSKDYNISNTILSGDRARQIIFESPYLTEWINKTERASIWQQQKQRTISFLVTMHYTSAYIHTKS